MAFYYLNKLLRRKGKMKTEMNTSMAAYRLAEIDRKMSKLKEFFATANLHISDGNIRTVLNKFLELKKHIGNFDNDIHFLASCLANSFLNNKHGARIDLDKAAGSAGLDMELEDIVAEIKTTIP